MIELTEKEWTEVYYALEYKAKLLDEGFYGKSDPTLSIEKWSRQLKRIMKKIRKEEDV